MPPTSTAWCMSPKSPKVRFRRAILSVANSSPLKVMTWSRCRPIPRVPCPRPKRGCTPYELGDSQRIDLSLERAQPVDVDPLLFGDCRDRVDRGRLVWMGPGGFFGRRFDRLDGWLLGAALWAGHQAGSDL